MNTEWKRPPCREREREREREPLITRCVRVYETAMCTHTIRAVFGTFGGGGVSCVCLLLLLATHTRQCLLASCYAVEIFDFPSVFYL